MKRIAVVGAVVLAGGLLGAAPASAAVSPHCQEDGYCLFSGTQFSGTKAVLPTSWGCYPVSSLGFGPARSAARGYGDGSALAIYSDANCANRLAFVHDEVPATTALSYRLLPIPG
ncbi:hypothetical protein ABZ816_30260 [Actinosynnema sp. NPDC047251]|uniref:Putative secreted protein n=1 Tax=Saccharothrix espanaensis (strain ATCC 51144 / DSM 44229 / JCM 9112 / NBRC 15066 / NRRL 15764) TaxID=1179773 RepID=K0K8E7_SACES|nr:hypothetical protein [Saccharothrix espanaensis]CCH34636.1 putative secreted protein [Saccharothrix espanaensis DSM 44229]